MRFRLLSKRYLPPAWFGKKGSRHSQQNVSNKFKDLAVVQIKSWNCGNGWHSYKRYQFFGAAEIGAVEPHESVYLYRTYGVLYHKSMQSPSPCSSPNYGPNLTKKKVGFQGSNLESSWIVGRSEKKIKLLGSRWLFWRKGSWSLATGPIKSDPNHTCGWYTLVLVISLVEVGLW